MSLETKAKTQLKQLLTGIHLVTITDVWLAKDNQGKPIKTAEGETGVTVRFTNGKNFSFDNTFWLKGSREWMFKKMCSQAGINPSAPQFKAESVGKRLWIYIKEVHDIDGDLYIQDDITGMPVINYYIFDYSMCDNPKNKPLRKGDPDTNNGEASDDFLGHRQISATQKLEKENKVQVTSSASAPKEQRIEKAKEIMGDTLVKSKVMQPNTEFHMEVGVTEPLPKREPQISNDDIFNDDFMDDNVSETKVEPTTSKGNDIPDDEEIWELG